MWISAYYGTVELHEAARSPVGDRTQVPAAHHRIQRARRAGEVMPALSEWDLPGARDGKTMAGGGSIDPRILPGIGGNVIKEALILLVVIVVPGQERVALAEVLLQFDLQRLI